MFIVKLVRISLAIYIYIYIAIYTYIYIYALICLFSHLRSVFSGFSRGNSYYTQMD